MTDGMTEAYRAQRITIKEREEHRLAIRRWLAQQLNRWATSSYLTVQESDHARQLAASLQEDDEVKVRTKGGKTTGTSTRKTGASAKSSKRT